MINNIFETFISGLKRILLAFAIRSYNVQILL